MKAFAQCLVLSFLFLGVMSRNYPDSEREKSYSKFDRKCNLPEEVACNYEACYTTPQLSATLGNGTSDPWPATEFYGFVHKEEVKSQGDCCWSCGTTLGCKYWLWSPNENSPCRHAMEKDVNFVKCSKSGHPTLPMMGGKCDPKVGIESPSLVEQTLKPKWSPFDTPMEPETSVCLLTSQNLNMNGKMRGYWFSDQPGSEASETKQQKGKNFISELGFVWIWEGKEHRARFEAKKGLLRDSEGGFMRYIQVDGRTVTDLKMGERTSMPGGISVTLEQRAVEGTADMESYRVMIAGVLDVQVRVRKADELYRTEKDDFVHFEVLLDELEGGESADVSGMLGEMYNQVQESTVLEQKSSEREFSSSDFVSSSVLRPDCPASTFKRSDSVEKISSF